MAFLKFNKSELVNLEYSLKREIILANETGAYCNTSLVCCNTRRYHGLLAVPVDGFGGGKYMLLSSVDESLVMDGKQFNLGIHCYGDIYEPRGHKYIIDFDADPVPEIIYKVGDILFSKSIMMVPDNDQVLVRYTLLEAPHKTELKLKPFLAFRNVHSLTHQNGEADTEGRDIQGGVAYRMYEGFPDLNLQLSGKASFKKMPYWYNGITYSDEYRRGFDCTEDLFVPGEFSTELKPGDSVILSASVTEVSTRGLKRKFDDIVAKMDPIHNYHDLLVHNANMLKCKHNGKEQINAGLSWLQTGLLRETIESLPGLTIYADGNTAEFEKILDTLIADEQERLFHRTTQVESPLRLTDTLQQYIEFTGDEKKVWKKYGPTLKGIIESYAPGRRREVTMHPNGLLWAQMDWTALSWMNTYISGQPVNERAGYQVETNAFWYNALCFAIDMETRYGTKKNNAFIAQWTPVRDLVKQNFQPTFWNAEHGYLADYVDGNGQNLDVRPNQMFAVYLRYSPVDDEVMSSVMSVVSNELVTRRGIRTLSPRNIKYKGVYEGSQTDRDQAYHNGCAFPSLLAPYVEICFNMMGQAFYKKAEWLTEGFYEDINKHGVGVFAELYDGDPPHEPHGAIACACSTAALLKIDYLMNKYKEGRK
ncbi:MAG: glycogen debranching enzyme family protein [Bacteroidetes bacterium]|uniref:Glycogen debranching enzyme family protein n=1 Tax=Candidatus Cryptobacteroides intestinavium TaxID=2840766 RepID=A0A9D9EVY0_9BACT|nr:glycogen debranching enzyme family protein [Candidatus Cryptobacteroides intestinavium]